MTIPQILSWADEYHRITGRWPGIASRPKGMRTGETWRAVQMALFVGLRGLPGGSSLAKLLAEQRDVHGPLTPERILAWADAHFEATGEWPRTRSGRVRGAYRERWETIDCNLRDGRRGLPGGSSLARLLGESRNVRNIHTLPRLSIELVLAWGDAYHAKTGLWPRRDSGPVDESPGDYWRMIDWALTKGWRGLPVCGTLTDFLVEHRGAPAFQTGRPLTIEQILVWADAHREATGRWPIEKSGPVIGAPEEKWEAISLVLAMGQRGLPGGSSLPRLLAEHRGARNNKGMPRLTFEQIRSWAESYRARHGRWPTRHSGVIADSPTPGETWCAIDSALGRGLRSLPKGMTLARICNQARAC
jgi:hypothetical protein